MTYRLVLSYVVATLLLAGCAAQTQSGDGRDPQHTDRLIEEGLAGTGITRKPPTDSVTSVTARTVDAKPTTSGRQILRGNRSFIAGQPDRPTATKPVGDNGVTFNFTNQPIQAVATIILGDMLQENFSIAQGVTGEVTFSTSKPVDKSQALSILETLLSWTNNALIRQGDRYVVLPANQAVAGQLVPHLAMSQPNNGLTARLYVLDYLSAIEMQKLLKPFARDNAFLLVDAARNVLVMAGTPDEQKNYQSTIDTFDVNWLKGMSIGVFGLKRASVTELMPELNRLFGAQSGTPLAGMLRFLPIERTNAIVAISSQPEYLNEVSRWIETIDQGGGNEPQMYVYDARNLKATDLAKYLRQIYGNETVVDDSPAQVAPGLRTLTMSSNGGAGSGLSNGLNSGPANGMGGMGQAGINGSGSNNGLNKLGTSDSAGNSLGNNDEAQDSNNANTSKSGNRDNSVRITAQKSSNQLLVRCRPTEWAEIESAIQRLDIPPMQVQIETRILEVNLSGELNQGVQWYLGRLAGNSATTGIQNVPGSQGALGAGGAALSANDSLFYSFVSNNLQVAIHALESNGNTRVLSAPSLVVMNNQQAQIQVGDNIPINQTSISTNNTLVTASSVQYIQTGVILDVMPRINPGGLVYMDIQQQVSNASQTTDANGNPTISTRAVSTQVAVQSGETVLLGGLIQEDRSEKVSSVPYLGRVPGLGWLFSNTQRNRGRSELIVLITPKVIMGNSQARRVTDEYREQFQLLKPLSEK